MDIQDLLLVILSELSLTRHLHHNTAQAQKEGIAQSHLAIILCRSGGKFVLFSYENVLFIVINYKVSYLDQNRYTFSVHSNDRISS